MTFNETIKKLNLSVNNIGDNSSQELKTVLIKNKTI